MTNASAKSGQRAEESTSRQSTEAGWGDEEGRGSDAIPENLERETVTSGDVRKRGGVIRTKPGNRPHLNNHTGFRLGFNL